MKMKKKRSSIMTSDAKIGLLLGLAFIFIIAFVINGLPSFLRGDTSNELTTNMAACEDETPEESETSEFIYGPETEDDYASDTAMSDSPAVDSEMYGPADYSAVGSSALDYSTVGDTRYDGYEPTTRAGFGNDVVAEDPPAWPKTYVVETRDNLGTIAKKFYGEQEGNRRANVVKIFEANRGLLKTPDEVFVGQEIVIPGPAETLPDSVLSPTMFDSVESIGTRHIPSYSNEPVGAKWYVVEQGDSLWKIATEQLGSSTRYKEIVNLNTDILTDESSIGVGMRLRLPVQ